MQEPACKDKYITMSSHRQGYRRHNTKCKSRPSSPLSLSCTKKKKNLFHQLTNFEDESNEETKS